MKRILFVISFLVNIARSQVTATFVGDTVKIWDTGFSWSCTGKFFPVINTSQDTIYITERDTMRLATCSCYFAVSTSLSGLNAGTYTAVVIRQHIEHITVPIDTVYVSNQYAGTVTFTILNSPSISPKVSFYQSGCNSNPGGVTEEKIVPDKFAMLTNYPNPFNPSTTIRFTIPNTTHTTLTVYNVIGQQVTTLLDEIKSFGIYEVKYETQNIPSGVYICRLNYGVHSLFNKIVLQK
jgi:hypothetical protein